MTSNSGQEGRKQSSGRMRELRLDKHHVSGLTQRFSQEHYSLDEAQVHHSLQTCSFRVKVSPNLSLRISPLSMRPLAFSSLVTTAIYVIFQGMAVPTPYRSTEPQRLPHTSPCTGACCPSRVRRGSESLVALLRLRPHPRLPTLIDLDVNHVRPTADGTVLDIFLRSARRCIDWYHNFFAAAVAHIARIAAHGNDSSRTMTDA